MKKIKKFFVAFIRLCANHCIIPYFRHKLFRLSGLKFGRKTYINMGLNIIDDYENLIEIGEAVALSPNITLIVSSHPNFSALSRNQRYIKKEKIFIENHAWIGTGAVIMPGIKIGKKAIVGANAVVTKNVNDGEIVAGVPAKPIDYTEMSDS